MPGIPCNLHNSQPEISLGKFSYGMGTLGEKQQTQTVYESQLDHPGKTAMFQTPASLVKNHNQSKCDDPS